MKRKMKSSLIFILFALAFITISNNNVASISVVYPSGDITGVIDANNIENALNNIAVGGTVVLGKGHFYVSRSIKIDGFHGTLKGKGKDDTVIEAVRSGPNLGQGFQFYYDPIYDAELQSIVYFYEPSGDVQIKDLTTLVIDPNPCDPWEMPWLPVITTTLSTFFRIAKSDFNTKLENVRMKGDYVQDEMPWFNVQNPYVVHYCESNGRKHTVKNCDFVGGTWAIEISEMFGNSIIEIKENSFTNSRGAMQYYSDYTLENTMKVIVTDNTITQCGLGICIVGISNSIIRENKITQIYLIDLYFSGVGIVNGWSFWNTIKENEIEDCALYGIFLGWWASYNQIIENVVINSGFYDLFWDYTGEENIWKENEFDTANFDT